MPCSSLLSKPVILRRALRGRCKFMSQQKLCANVNKMLLLPDDFVGVREPRSDGFWLN